MTSLPLPPLRPDGYRDLSAGDALMHLGALRLVDVREPAEFVGPLGHIDGAELVPLSTLLSAAEGWDRGRPLLLICRSGARSARGGAALAAMGFTAVYNLVGGMMGWNDSGLPAVEKGPA